MLRDSVSPRPRLHLDLGASPVAIGFLPVIPMLTIAVPFAMLAGEDLR